jgi:hypothetical protein
MKRGQSAFELITTYGWVFLTIVAISATLAFLNFTNPSVFLEEDCSVNSEFSCLDFGISENDSFSGALFVFRNRLPEPLSDKSNLVCFFGETITETKFESDVESGEIFEISCEGPPQGWINGTKRKINFKIVYYTNITSRGIPQVANGHLYAKVK